MGDMDARAETLAEIVRAVIYDVRPRSDRSRGGRWWHSVHDVWPNGDEITLEQRTALVQVSGQTPDAEEPSSDG